MKRTLSVLFAILMILTIIGCSNIAQHGNAESTGPLPTFTKPTETNNTTDNTTATTEVIPDDPGDIGHGGVVDLPETSIPLSNTAPTETDPTVETTVATAPAETTTTTPIETTTPATEPESSVIFTEVDETVYANTSVNIRTGPSTDYEKIGSLKFGEEIQRTGIGDNGWSRVIYNGETAYMFSDYIQTEKPVSHYDGNYPLTYSDGSCTITVYREWYADDDNNGAWCYAAHLVFSDYSRFGTDCANGVYNDGCETTSQAARRLGAVFAVNGCYSAPYLDYTVVRNGVLCNGSGRTLWTPAVYSNQNGLLLSAWESGGTSGIAGANIDSLVENGLVTDTFCFGPPILSGGWCSGDNGSRAQRTFMGTNGNPGDIWVVVSDGRYNDGESAGLTYAQCANYLASKGCVFGIPLDGGGSSTMYFNGQVLNAARNGQRSVVDFVYFK